MRRAGTGISILVALLASGCSAIPFITDHANDYLEAQTLPPIDIPGELDAPPRNDLMVVPEIIDSRGISGQEFDVPLPDPLSVNYGVDRIVIKRLLDTRWIFLDLPPAMIWTNVVGFWQENNLTLAKADPAEGLLETVWLTSQQGDADTVFESLTSGRSRTGPASALVENKFQLKVEPGVRSGSSEITLRHRQAALGERRSAIDWSLDSDVDELEEKVLNELAFYLGDYIDQGQSVSLLASGIRNEAKAELHPDKTRPVLTYKLDFDRAWATVGAALESAAISVEDLDRSSAVYFVNFRDPGRRTSNIFSRMFRDDGDPGRPVRRFRVHLDQSDDGVDVTVLVDPSTLAAAPVAERLLKIIKEYST